MMKRCQLFIWLFASLMVLVAPQASDAQWTIGVRVGTPVYGRPFHGYYGAPYYYGPRVIYAAPPVVYAAPPVVYAPAAVVVRQPSYATEYEAPLPTPSVVPVPPASNSTQPPVIPVRSVGASGANAQVDSLVAQLRDNSDSVRRDAAMELGRMKATQALDALIAVLSKDGSPVARDGAARALGLIASPRSLGALTYAAQADADRDVRHSAQFSVEIIRTNLRGN